MQYKDPEFQLATHSRENCKRLLKLFEKYEASELKGQKQAKRVSAAAATDKHRFEVPEVKPSWLFNLAGMTDEDVAAVLDQVLSKKSKAEELANLCLHRKADTKLRWAMAKALGFETWEEAFGKFGPWVQEHDFIMLKPHVRHLTMAARQRRGESANPFKSREKVPAAILKWADDILKFARPAAEVCPVFLS